MCSGVFKQGDGGHRPALCPLMVVCFSIRVHEISWSTPSSRVIGMRSPVSWDAYPKEVSGQIHYRTRRMATLELQRNLNAGECHLIVDLALM